MSSMITIRSEKRSEQEILASYIEVTRDPRINKWMAMTLLPVLLAFGSFVLWVYSTGAPKEMIDIAAPFAGIALGIAMVLAHILRRCPKCHSRFRQFANANMPGHRFIVCESCKTFFREIESGG
jgi:apolipoprotein N-acyltransferase